LPPCLDTPRIFPIVGFVPDKQAYHLANEPQCRGLETKACKKASPCVLELRSRYRRPSKLSNDPAKHCDSELWRARAV